MPQSYSVCCVQPYRYWIKQKTTGRGFCRPLRKPYVCGSSKWGRWRPFITLWTSVISTLLRNVWSLRSGVPFLTSIPFNSLCGGERWVIFIHDDFDHWDVIYFSHSIHKWKQENNMLCIYSLLVKSSDTKRTYFYYDIKNL